MALAGLIRANRRDLVALAFALLGLCASWTVLTLVRRTTDPRSAIVRDIRREASVRDLLIVTEEAPELVEEAAPIPALWGTVPLEDLSGIRRVYVLAPSVAALGTYKARFGPGRPMGATAMAWNLALTAKVVFDAVAEVGVRLTAHRDGGADGGPCPRVGAELACHGPHWNRVRAEPHHFDGVEIPCVFGHPQADGHLVIELAGIPPAAAVVGAVGIDDGGYFPEGAPVTMTLDYRPQGRPAMRSVIVAPNRRGVTAFRMDVPTVAAAATITITTPDAGARQFCFNLEATR